MEVAPRILADPGFSAATSMCGSTTGDAGAAVDRSRTTSPADHPRGEPPGAVSGGHAVVQPRAGHRRSATRSTPSSGGAARNGTAGRRSTRSSRGPPRLSRPRWRTQPLLILAALVAVYIVLGILYESYIHPITILSTLPSAGVGAILALLLCRHGSERDRADRHHPADRHRQEERDHDDRLRVGGGTSGRQAARGGDLRGLPVALPSDHDDDVGGAAGGVAAGPRHGDRLGAPPAARESRSSAASSSASCSRCTRRRSSISTWTACRP